MIAVHYVRGTPAERLWPRMRKQEDGCWIWTGGTSTDGYGNIGHPRGVDLPKSTHRLAWTLTYGPIPDGLWVLHKCDVKRCCNPDHLFLGDRLANIRDMVRKGRANSGNALKTHCKYGHPFDEKNTRFTLRADGPGTTKRACRTCHREYERARRAALRLERAS